MSERYITLTDGTNSSSLRPPMWGVQSELHLALKIVRNSDGSYSSWDNGKSNDFRVCKSAKFWSTIANQIALNNIIRTNRGDPLQLILGTSSGFNPWGPDLGDSGTHIFNVLSHDSGGIQLDPFRTFESAWSMVLVSSPAFTPPSPAAQGTVQIGTATGLPYPDDGFKPSINYAVKIQQSQTGLIKIDDRGTNTDAWETQFSVECNAGNAAAVLMYLQTIARGYDFTISLPSNSYAFGADKNSSGTFTVRLTSNIIAITHITVNRFKIDLSIWMKS